MNDEDKKAALEAFEQWRHGASLDQTYVECWLRAFELATQAAQQWTDSDQPLHEDQAIQAAHPLETRDFRTYMEAKRLVGAKRSKYALVDLVNWLLVEKQKATQATYERAAQECVAQQDKMYEDYGSCATGTDCAKAIRALAKGEKG